MSVELEPSELGFRRPFTHEVSQVLQLSNPNSDPVAFKVKTTAPKQYCVRPNSGKIDPGKNVEVQVLLQAMKEDPPLDAKCRDKFLVQSVLIDGNQEDVTSIWSNIDKLAKDSVKERKIRVTFLPPSASSASREDSVPIPDEAPPAYSSPSPSSGLSPGAAPPSAQEYGTPTRAPAQPANVNGDNTEQSSTPMASTVTSTLNTAASSVSAAASSTNEALKSQLENAQATIKDLRARIEEQGLRQRKSDAVAQDARERVTTGTTGLGVQSQPTEGVPVQIVAALCLVSFLLAYLFF